MDLLTFPDWMRGERERRGWSCGEVGRRLGEHGHPRSRQAIHNYEAAMRLVPADVRPALLDVFGIDDPTERLRVLELPSSVASDSEAA